MKTNMSDRIVVYLSVIILACASLSFRWPLNNGKVTSSFGESRGDHFHDGTDMIASDKKIYPVNDGKLVYFWNKAIFPFENYTGSGNYKIISHDNNLFSVYLHMDDSQQFIDHYNEKDPIGLFGNTGRSLGSHIHFSLLDGKKMDSINPFLMLPQYKDIKAPVVGAYALKIGDKYVQVKAKSKIRLTKNWPLLIRITDECLGGERIGIYSLQVSFNGKIVDDIKFDTLSFVKNDLTISGKNFDTIYDPDGYYKIDGLEYQSGVNTIEVTAADFSGNKTTDIFSFDVTLDR